MSMKRFFLFSLVMIMGFAAQAQNGYNINISLKPYKNTFIYLGYYYGKMKALADSAYLDENSSGVFKGSQPLNGGIYFVVSPKKEILFEVLLDKNQQFSISGDTTNLPFSINFSGSVDNTQFQSYSGFAHKTGLEINKASTAYRTAKTHKDSIALSAKLKTLNERINHFRDSISKKYPGSFLSALFNAIREPVIPPATKHPGGKYDSNYAYQYYKSHYWDGVSLSDERLVRTPFFEPRLEKYYNELVAPSPDSIKREVDAMLLEARASKEMFKYLMVHFVQKYINPQYMGQDAVFVHLFEKYINTGQADFFTEQYKEHMTKRAYSLMANLIGQPAANMEMVDTLAKPTSLYSVKGPFTVICFWDPTCGHCKEVVPQVDSIFKAKWKQQGVKIYGVKTDGTNEEWKRFINDHNLKDWIHVYQSPAHKEEETAAGKPNFRQLYDVYQTPMLYLLDKDKRIIAKKLTYLQLDEVISLKLKNPNSN